MSTVLTLTLLGAYRVVLPDQLSPHFKTDKVRALLAYLAIETRPHERSFLADLFWPGMPEPSALRNLTQTLVRLRQAISDVERELPYLLVTRTSVQFNPASAAEVDVTQLVAAATGGLRTGNRLLLESALALYQGELLVGFSLPDSEPFDEWLLLQREYLHQLAVDVAHTLTTTCLATGDYRKAETYAQRQLALDAWRESAHRQLMEALARNGQRAAALRQYEICRQVLLTELGIAPEAATTALYEQIRHQKLGDPPSQTTSLAMPTVERDHSIQRDWSEAPESGIILWTGSRIGAAPSLA